MPQDRKEEVQNDTNDYRCNWFGNKHNKSKGRI